MGNYFLKSFKSTGAAFSLLSLLVAVESFAGEKFFLTGVRANQAQMDIICGAIPDCTGLEVTAKEFPNGNTFVTFKSNVSRKNVVIVIPEQLSADHFMEALIKIRTAKTMGALRIAPVIPKNGVLITSETGNPIKFNLGEVQMFARKAGADSVISSLNSESVDFEPYKSRMHYNLPREFNGDARSIVVGLGHNALAQDLAQQLGMAFVNGETPTLISAFPGVKHVVLVAPPVVPENETFLRALSWVNYHNQAYRITWVSSYLPYARSDKIDQPGVAVTGRLAADLMEVVGTGEVVVVRAHAPQSQGFFQIPTLQVNGRRTIVEHLKSLKIDVVVAPDSGAQKDDTLYANDLGVPINVINKARDPQTGVSHIIDISGVPLEGKRVAIIDDETASGGTLGEASEFLKNEKGVSFVAAVVTHLAGDAAKALTSDAIDQLVVTDSLPIRVRRSDRFTVLPISHEIAADIAPWLSAKTCESGLKEAK